MKKILFFFNWAIFNRKQADALREFIKHDLTIQQRTKLLDRLKAA
jgi:hypothetical protein